MTYLDQAVVEILYGIASENQTIRLLVAFFGNWSAYLIAPAFFMWAIFVWLKTSKTTILAQTALAMISSRITLEIIRLFLDIRRPFIALDIPPLFPPIDTGPALPSGHATFFFALAAVSWAHSKKISYVLFAAALLMGVGRVAAGVHWPTDILAGAMLGIIAGYLGRRIIK